MQKRSMTFGNYVTAACGWTLASWSFQTAKQKTYFVDKTGGNGAWDLSTALTDGQPIYYDRTLTVCLESSEGTRFSRKAEIRRMVAELDGQWLTIVLPDDPDYYIMGRVSVQVDYNDLVHAAATITAICDPWLYKQSETIYYLTASTDKQTAEIINGGRLAVVPVLTVSGSGASVLLEYDGSSQSMSAGTYQWPELFLTTGSHVLTYSGSGTLTITYREAVLE